MNRAVTQGRVGANLADGLGDDLQVLYFLFLFFLFHAGTHDGNCWLVS
jgi:hypothetical protein